MPDRRRKLLGFASMLLASILAGALVANSGSLSRVVWSPWIDCTAAVVLLLGAAIAGWFGRVQLTAIFPTLVAATYRPFVPDTRDIWLYRQNAWSLFALLAIYAASIAGVALACRTAAAVGFYARSLRDARRERQEYFCKNCGYDLRGLAARRCPECGTGFEHAIPSAGETRPND